MIPKAAWEANFNPMPANEGAGPDKNILMPSAILSTVRGFLRRESAPPFCLLFLLTVRRRRFIVNCRSDRDGRCLISVLLGYFGNCLEGELDGIVVVPRGSSPSRFLSTGDCFQGFLGPITGCTTGCSQSGGRYQRSQWKDASSLTSCPPPASGASCWHVDLEMRITRK